MSSSSSRSQNLNRRLNSRSIAERSRAFSRPQQVISRDDAYTFALRVAYLHHLLLPRSTRRQYAPIVKPPPAASIGHLLSEVAPTGSASLKLPSKFSAPLEKRIQGVVLGSERIPGFNDPAVKLSFAEAYIAFTDKSFKKSIDKEGNAESLILIFYSSAVKAVQKGCTDDSWKLLPDRHAALFVRLLAAIIRDQGHDRDKDLIFRLHSLENKLLSSDKNLGETFGGVTNEVPVPLSFAVKDMVIVKHVANVFGISAAQAQEDINAHRTLWNEEVGLRDLKSYLYRVNSDLAGALRSKDFDLESAFEEWKKAEVHNVSRMILDILAVNPELAKSSTSDTSLPPSAGAMGRLHSSYSEDQAYGDLSKAIMNADDSASLYPLTLELNFSSLSFDQPSTIRSVDDPSYTFIPHDPRAFYKAILQYAMAYDLSCADSSQEFTPLSADSMKLLIELSTRWRIPQSSRLVTFIEVIAHKFLDREIDGQNLDTAFELVKIPPPAAKKPPIQQFHTTLVSLERSYWVEHDFAVFQQTLSKLNEALLRDLYTLLMQCYEAKNPSIGVVMHNLQHNVQNHPAFSQSSSSATEFTSTLSDGLRQQADKAYRALMDEKFSYPPEEWNFVHVVGLGKSLTQLCERIRKRYHKNPVIMGVNPYSCLVETVFPIFEADVCSIVKRILQIAASSNTEVHVLDGFSLYNELASIREVHKLCLPNKPFQFDLEELLIDFAWRYIKDADKRQVQRIEEAIKLDPFKVRNEDPDRDAEDSERHSTSIMDVFTLFSATINEVIQLDWENNYHNAKFMTALAKSFSTGLARYCELVEQQFIKEMDRQTSQDAMIVSMTTQERIFQYAKVALSAKDKHEPFQFNSESFVKLNNVEFAINQMDRLESTMNINAVAEVIQRMEGPITQTRKPSNYIFTVKIVEAEDLKACDPTGSSDPYVILGDEYRKRLYKSKIMYKTLNPRWDESVDISSQGPVNLVVTIWDWDMFGDHDCVGRTSLKLDPLQFSDYLPREFWLDLDTQGRVLLRVSMEGERDDIQFHFGKAFRCLKRTERDMVRKITEKLSPMLNQALSKDTLRSLLKTGGIGASVASFWKKTPGPSSIIAPTNAEIEGALLPLCNYFNDNFRIMNQTLTKVTMNAVMVRLWKEALMVFEALLVPSLSEKPSTQKPLSQTELEVVFSWLTQLYEFFNAKDQSGEQLGVPADLLKSPKYLELFSVNFFYLENTNLLIKESERLALGEAQRMQQDLMRSIPVTNRLSAPVESLGLGLGGPSAPFASLGTIRRGKSLMMSRNLGMMQRVKEERRREAQAEPNDDMILRILRMRPEAASYLKERLRQKERQAATAAAAMIVKNSVSQGWNTRLRGTGSVGGLHRRSGVMS